MSDLWTWREVVVVIDPDSAATNPIKGTDVTGFDVEASDGHIGKIDEATYEVGSSYVVVDTGPWIFGSTVMLPAGTISRLDRSSRRAYVARSKDEIKAAPRFDKDACQDPDYRDRVGEY